MKGVKDTAKYIVTNIFRSEEEAERRQRIQEGMANIICRTESNQQIQYKRVKCGS